MNSVEIIGTGTGSANISILSPLEGSEQIRCSEFYDIPLSNLTEIYFSFDETVVEDFWIFGDLACNVCTICLLFSCLFR